MRSIAERAVFEAFASAAAEFAGHTIDDRKISLASIDTILTFDLVGKPVMRNVLAVDVIAEHATLNCPIHFTAVGIGEHLSAAATSSAEQWFSIVFPVLRDLWGNEPSLMLDSVTITSTEQRTRKQFHWNAIIGPVRVISRDTPATADPGAIFHTLREEITLETVSIIPFWIDAFVAINDDNTIASDCRLTNQEWPEGSERLAERARELLPSSIGFVSWRQFIFFEPKSTAPFSAPNKISDDRPWWKRLLPFGE